MFIPRQLNKSFARDRNRNEKQKIEGQKMINEVNKAIDPGFDPFSRVPFYRYLVTNVTLYLQYIHNATIQC